MVRLKELRERKKLNQEQLGDKFNLSQQTISSYEKATREPDTKLLNSFADFFDVTVDYLLGRTDEKNIYKLEGKELPEELREVGIEYITLAKDFKESGLTPEEIQELIDFANKIKNKEK